jgi:hypothetical protein
MPETSVKWFSSTMAGAPQLSATLGTFVPILDACLVNGFGSVLVSSLIVVSGVATATVSAGHGFLNEVIVLISGATPSGLNGEKRITVLSSTTFSFIVTGISDVSATGTITAKMAPAGWELQFSKTNVRVYRSLSPLSSKMCARVVDIYTSTHYVSVYCYESMSNVDTGVNTFGNGNLIGYDIRNSAKWAVISDDRFFYVFTTYSPTDTNALIPSYFGDFISNVVGDGYPVVFGGMYADAPSPSYCDGTSLSPASKYQGIVMARASNQIAIGRNATQIGSRISSSFAQGGMAYPDPQSGGLTLHPVYLREISSGLALESIRGRLPGQYQILNTSPLSHLAITDGPDGRRILLVRGSVYNASTGALTTTDGRYAFDISGPWR